MTGDQPTPNQLRGPRRFPRWSELSRLLSVRAPTRTRRRRVAAAATIDDLRRLARRRAPRAVFDYVDGGADAELALRRSRAAYAEVEFVPRVLRDVSRVTTATRILGRDSALPLALAPTGFTRMMHTEGERAVALAAGRAGIPYALSTLGTTSIEDLAAAAPDTRRWFQLYVWKDRAFSGDLIQRARAHGYEALMLTVDVPVAGRRLRDVRNGLQIPPRLTLGTLLDGATRPRWWWDLLTTQPLVFASLTDTGGTVADLVDRVFDPGVSTADFDWLRENWDGPILVKGIQSPADARLVTDHGADAVVVSNHGGRQLDRAPTTLELLPAVVDEVGSETEVYVDGGVTTGADIAAAVALGARAVLVGRAYLYGLMAGGHAGVARALAILEDEYVRTLRLLGVTDTAGLGREHVRVGRDR